MRIDHTIRTARALRLLIRQRGRRGLRLVAWTVRARRRVRRQVARAGLDAVRLPPPPPCPPTDVDLVLRALRRDRANCLERSLVLQRWYAAQRSPHVVVIGVTAPSGGFHAHAWLDGEPDPHRDTMVELLRRPTPDAWLARR